MKWFIEFIFTDFWRFVGFVIVLAIVCDTLSDIVEALKRKK